MIMMGMMEVMDTGGYYKGVEVVEWRPKPLSGLIVVK
jgi:hypothetical protein